MSLSLIPKSGKLPLFVLATMAILALAARAFPATALDTLAENRAKWKEHRPSRYAFTYKSDCGRSCLAPRWRIEAEGDSVIRVTNLDPLVYPGPPADNLQLYSIGNIFIGIGTNLTSRTGGHEIRYNALLGYPETALFTVSPPEFPSGSILWVTDFQGAGTSARIPSPSPAAADGKHPGYDLAGRAVRRSGTVPLFAIPRR